MAKYKFTNKNHAEGGVVSCIMGFFALVILCLAIYLSYEKAGNAGQIVGNMAIASFLLSFFGTVIGLLSYKEQEKYYIFSHIGSTFCGIFTIFMIAVFAMGI